MPTRPSVTTQRSSVVLLAAIVAASILPFSTASAATSPGQGPTTVRSTLVHGGPVPSRPHLDRRHLARHPRRPRARLADYGTVRSECSRSVPGGGTIKAGFDYGYAFGFPIGSTYYARVIAYIGSTFVSMTDWHQFVVANGGATGYSIDANHAVIGGTGAPTGLFGFRSVPARTRAAAGIETWSASTGYVAHWVPAFSWDVPTSGFWCYFP
jgi:hypothetical protein